MATTKTTNSLHYLLEHPAEASFEDFYELYAGTQKFDHVPDFHYELIDFLSKPEDWKNDTAVVQCFRNAAKSSIVAPWVVWMLVRKPDLVFLIQSADNKTAKKMVSDVKKIVRIHPFAKHLFRADLTWTSNEISVVGSVSGRNFSVSSQGIFSNVTGGRAHIIIYDDVEVPKNSRSEHLREDIRSRISESAHLLEPNGKRLFIGTPHAHESIYPEQIDSGASSYRKPLLEDISGEFPFIKGTSNWPQRWTEDLILMKQRGCKGRAEFLSQYQLEPVSSEDSYLDIQNLKEYGDELEFISANRATEFRFRARKVTDIRAWWDPAISGGSGDSSVLSIVFCTEDGDIYLHRSYEVKGDVDSQCEQVKKHLTDHHIAQVMVEANGIGATFPQILRKHVGGLVGIVKMHTSQKKSESILEAFETPMSAGILYVHESVRQTKFRQQMRDFNPRFMKGKDDFIDSAAKAIQQLKVVIGKGVRHSIPGYVPYRKHSEPAVIPRTRMFAQ